MPRVSKADQKHEESASRARGRKESALADLRELERDKRRGELVEVKEVELLWGRIFSNCRNKIMGLPSRIIQHVPHELAPRVHEDLRREVHDILTELADSVERIDLDAPPEPEADKAEAEPTPKRRTKAQ